MPFVHVARKNLQPRRVLGHIADKLPTRRQTVFEARRPIADRASLKVETAVMPSAHQTAIPGYGAMKRPRRIRSGVATKTSFLNFRPRFEQGNVEMGTGIIEREEIIPLPYDDDVPIFDDTPPPPTDDDIPF